VVTYRLKDDPSFCLFRRLFPRQIGEVPKGLIAAGIVVVIAALAVAFLVALPKLRPLPPPLSVTMSVSPTNRAMSVFPSGNGAAFIFPDGSLWDWGQDAISASHKVKLLDREHRWVRAVNRLDTRWVGLDDKGAVLERLAEGAQFVSYAPPTNHGFIELTGGALYSLGLLSDGTLLGWESIWGRGAVSPTAVHTNFVWRTISAGGPQGLGVSRDGKLWSWQRKTFSPLTFTVPTLESAETNWVGVAEGCHAWSQSGDLWGAPIAHLNSSNAVLGRFSVGSEVHEIRADGTLWAIGGVAPWARRAVGAGRGGGSYSYYVASSIVRGAGVGLGGGSAASSITIATRVELPRVSASKNKNWHQIGKRSDWVSVWSSEQTYFGLTADGTVWVWGTDWGQEPFETSRDRLARLSAEFRERLRSAVGMAPSSTPVMMTVTQPYQAEPRPLIRFETAK
jgi:hypothetical protein